MSDLTFQLVDDQGDAVAIRGLPLVRPVTLFFKPLDNPPSRQATKLIIQTLLDFLLHLNQAARASDPPPCQHGLDQVASCPLCADTQRQKLLILVGQQEYGKVAALTVPDENWWLADPTSRKILPLSPADTLPTAWLPEAYQLYNPFYWNNSAREAVSAILSASTVTRDFHRIFVSYRRIETQPLADQLFVELTKQGFDVFLDRYSIAPSIDFQRSLHHELAEKSMVLILESDRFGESKWTTEEVAYCKQYRFGLASALMPNGREPDPSDPKKRKATRTLAHVDDEYRIRMEASWFVEEAKEVDQAGKEYLQWGPLKAGELLAFVQQIKTRHDKALLDRLQRIRDDMLRALRAAGLQGAQLRADGMVIVQSGSKLYVIWVATHPPELSDFHLAHSGSRYPNGTTGVIIGHRLLLEPELHHRLVWLSGVSKVVLIDEGRMTEAAFDIAGGIL